MDKSIKKNYIFNMIYQIILIIVPFLVTPYLSKTLQPDGIGQNSFANSLISYFTLFATFGFDSYATREIAKLRSDPEKQNKFFWEIIFCRLITVSISLVVNIVLLVCGVYGKNSILMLIMTINILSIAFDIGFYFQGNEEFGKIVLRSLIIKVFYTISIFVFVKQQSDLWKYVLLGSISTFLNATALWFTIRKKVKKPNFKELKPQRHFKYALALFIPAVASNIYSVLGKTLIGVILDDEIADAQNGYYEQTDKIFRICVTLVTCLGTVMNSRNSNEISKGNHEGVKNNIYMAFNFIWVLTFPITFGLIAVANNFVPWFLGEAFVPAIPILYILACTIPVMGVSNIFGTQYLVPYGRDKNYTISIITGAGVSVVANLVLIYYFKAVGASIATFISEFTVAFMMFLFLKKELSFKKMFGTMIKPFISAVIMFLIVGYVSTKFTPTILHTIILILIGVVVYFVMLLILRERLMLSTLKSIKEKFTKKKLAKSTTISSKNISDEEKPLTSEENEKIANSTQTESNGNSQTQTNGDTQNNNSKNNITDPENDANPLIDTIENLESEVIDMAKSDSNHSKNEDSQK